MGGHRLEKTTAHTITATQNTVPTIAATRHLPLQSLFCSSSYGVTSVHNPLLLRSTTPTVGGGGGGGTVFLSASAPALASVSSLLTRFRTGRNAPTHHATGKAKPIKKR